MSAAPKIGTERPTTQGATSGYRVSFVNYLQSHQMIGAEISAAVNDVLARGQFILRDEMKRFEQELAAFLKVRHVLGLNSGTDALYLAVRAAGIGPGDEVITVAHTFLATVGAIVFAGATPRLVEIGDDFNLDVNRIEEAITPRTKAIIPVHLNGRLVAMDRVMSLAKRHGLLVIEDSAQALGASYAGISGGAWGLAGCFSFYPAKILGTAGDAGALSTNDDDLADKIRALRDNGRAADGGQSGYGFNSRLDNLHAAILLVKLRYLPVWIQQRRAHALAYDEGLRDIEGLSLPPPPHDGQFFDVYQNYVVRTARKPEAMDFLKQRGVEILVNCGTPLHRYESLALGPQVLPMTERLVSESFSLPLYPELEVDQRDYVIATLREFFSR